jgi:hypothetical protein
MKHNIAFGWYTPKSWARLLEVSVDAEGMASSYEEFATAGEKKVQMFEDAGVEVTKVMIDPDHMAAWCKRHGLILDSIARASYGAALAGAEGDTARLDEMGFEDQTGELRRLS